MHRRHSKRKGRLDIEKLESLLIEIEGYCYSNAVLTFSYGEMEFFTVDLIREGLLVRYGHKPGVKELLMAKLLRGGGILLRSFLSEEHPDTGHPMKEIRGYIVQMKHSVFDYTKLPPAELKECCESHYITGESIKPEKEAIYC